MTHIGGFIDKVGFIWSVADLLRGDYKAHEYGQVILPLVNVLNDKFGMNLGEADQVWFDQQVEAAAADEDLREVAASNTEENFAFEFDRKFADVLEERHSLNDSLFRAFFDKPEFQDILTTWARHEVYSRIQQDLGGAA